MSDHPPSSGAIADPSPPQPEAIPAPLKCCSLAWFAAVSFVAVLYLLDQATKLWTAGLDFGRPGWPVLRQHLALGDHIEVAPNWFHWVHFSNTGAAFGVLQDSNRFFIGLSVVALLGLSWALKRNIFPGRLNLAAVLLLISGILGNFTDRLIHGYVVDFLYFDLGFPPFNPWPAFNVADSCICVAVVLLFLASFQDMRTSNPAKP